MALSAREVYLLLRAKDEASRVVRGFGANLLRTAAQVQAQALRAEAVNRRAEAQRLRNVGATRQQIQAQLDHARALEQEAREVERNAGVWRQRVQQMEAVGGALIGVGTGFALAGGVATKFFYDSAVFYEAYQKQVALTKTQVRDFKVSLAELSDIGLRVAQNVAVPFEEIQPALFDIFSSMDVNLRQGEILLSAFSRAAVAGNTSIRNAARGTISILNAFNIPAENVNRVLDIQFELVRRGVGTYEEFATKLGNVIPSAARAGQSVETMAAALVFLTRNGLSAAMSATSAARAFEAMSHPKAVAELESLGIKVKDVNGKFLPLNESLRKMRDYLMKLPPADRVAELVNIFKGAGGTIQARRFLEQVLLRPGELEEFEGYLKSIQTSTGAFEEAYGQMSDTVANKSQLLTNKWQVVKTAIGEALVPYLLKLIDALSKVLDWFNKLSPQTKNFIVILSALAAIGAVVLGGILVIVGGLVLIAAALVAAGAEVAIFLGVLAVLAGIVAAVGAVFAVLWKKSEPFRGIIKDMIQRFREARDMVVAFGENVKKAWDDKLGPPLHELWDLINTKVFPAFREFADSVWKVYGPKIEEAFRKIKDFASFAFGIIASAIRNQLIPAIQDVMGWWNRNKDNLKPFIEIAAQVAKWILIIAAVLAGSVVVGAIAGFILAIKIVVTTIKGLVYTFNLIKTVIGLVVDAVVWLGKKIWELMQTFRSWSKSVGEGIKSVMTAIVGFFSNAGHWLYDAGVKIVKGLIDGIKDKIGDLKDMAVKLAKTIKDHLPFSPAKVGPLSGRGNPFYSGQSIANMVAAGMMMQLPTVSSASTALARAVQSQLGVTNNSQEFGYPGQRGVESRSNQDTASKNVNTTVNVYTQEINPTKHAAELGFMITNRMS